ncbi:hypothetical protein [Nocardioides montaniterrae]
MIFYGWGRKSITKQIDAGTAVVRMYRYAHLFWVLSFTWGGSYQLATATESGWAHRAITAEQAAEVLGGHQLEPNLWKRFSLPVVIGLLVLLSLVARLV